MYCVCVFLLFFFFFSFPESVGSGGVFFLVVMGYYNM